MVCFVGESFYNYLGKVKNHQLHPKLMKDFEKKETVDPDWHRNTIGGLWDEIGKHQFNFLVKNGLEPEHYLLDIGCGSLRGGVHFIRYLSDGHYFGIDKNQKLLDAGRDIELQRYKLKSKKITLLKTDNFDFTSFNQKFEFAIAQSVFTHISLNSIIMCLAKIETVLLQGGKFFATFLENPKGKLNLEPIERHPYSGKKTYTYFDKDPFHYDFSTFQWVCQNTDLKVDYIGNWNHPAGPGSMMMLFTKL